MCKWVYFCWFNCVDVYGYVCILVVYIGVCMFVGFVRVCFLCRGVDCVLRVVCERVYM